MIFAAATMPLFGAPAQSQAPADAAIVAADFDFKTAAGASPSVTIATGGTVGFSYPTGSDAHNIVFTGPRPSACVQTAGTAGTPPPPLPGTPQGPGWAGTCTFTTPATYAFVCGRHSFMNGSITVPGGGTAPSPPPAPPRPPPPPPPLTAAVRAASAVRLAAVQRGSTIRGSVQVTSARSRLLARAFARRGALTGSAGTAQVQVGRQLRRSVGGTRVTFTVPLSPAVRRALRRNGRLAITLRLTVTPPAGAAYMTTRPVVIRPAA